MKNIIFYFMKFKKVLTIAVIFILILVIVSIEFINCPICDNTFLLKNLDPFCDYDGKVNLIQYISLLFI